VNRLALIFLLAATAAAYERRWFIGQADVIVTGTLQNHQVTFEGRDARVTGEIVVRRYVFGPDRSVRRLRYDSMCDTCVRAEERDEWRNALRHSLLQPGCWFLKPSGRGVYKGAGTNAGMGWQPLNAYTVQETLEVKERRSSTR